MYSSKNIQLKFRYHKKKLIELKFLFCQDYVIKIYNLSQVIASLNCNKGYFYLKIG